ncbi:MAG: iron-sulfur cluster repair di-iron protein [Planctomycetales bacterium]
MPILTTQSPVGEWAAASPDAIRLFERHGFNYCCGGHKPLAIACREAGVDPQTLIDELARSATVATAERDWSAASLAELCDHIERTHHRFLREQLPHIARLLDAVIASHSAQHPELREVGAVFAELRGELEPHMMKEERILFPAIRTLEQSVLPPMFPFGSVRNPIGMMEHEHDQAGEGLQRLRELTRDYAVPAGACTKYRALLDALDRLEADLHVHIHKENNILFPRAAELEGSAVATNEW